MTRLFMSNFVYGVVSLGAYAIFYKVSALSEISLYDE